MVIASAPEPFIHCFMAWRRRATYAQPTCGMVSRYVRCIVPLLSGAQALAAASAKVREFIGELMEGQRRA
jgi:hypothetical protein